MVRDAGRLGFALGLLAAAAGCTPDLFDNLTKERTGNISVSFVNNTPYRAAFSYGTYDAWDRSPGPVSLQQLRLAANSTSASTSVTCRRNLAIATPDFVERVIDTEADDTDTFDPDAFDTTVHFSSAPSDSDAAALPTAGTAEGIELLLGVDYSCADQVIFTFAEDPDRPGGFRIDYEVILDVRED